VLREKFDPLCGNFAFKNRGDARETFPPDRSYYSRFFFQFFSGTSHLENSTVHRRIVLKWIRRDASCVGKAIARFPRSRLFHAVHSKVRSKFLRERPRSEDDGRIRERSAIWKIRTILVCLQECQGISNMSRTRGGK